MIIHACAATDLAGKIILGCCQSSKQLHSSCAQVCARWEADDGQATKVSAWQMAARFLQASVVLVHQWLRTFADAMAYCVCT